MITIDRSFLNWYTQSLGGLAGILICTGSYLQGSLIVYGDILSKIDSVGISGVLASYILIPLCILTTIVGAIESYKSSELLNTISKGLIIITIVIGFVGTKIYFIIPSILILFKFYSKYIIRTKKDDTEKTNEVSIYKIKEELLESKIRKVIYNTNIEKNVLKNDVQEQREQMFSNDEFDTILNNNEENHFKTRVSMAKALLNKNSSKEFICEITGLEIEQIEALEKNS